MDMSHIGSFYPVYLLILLVIGIVQIFLAWSLYIKCHFRYLLLYVYYLIALNTFGFINNLGRMYAYFTMADQFHILRVVQGVMVVINFLAVPFLVISWFLFIYMIRVMVNKKVDVWVKTGFVLLQLIIIVGYSILIGVSGGEDNYEISDLLRLTVILSTVIGILIISAAIGHLFYYAKDFPDQWRRQLFKKLGIIYVLVFSVYYLHHAIPISNQIYRLTYPLMPHMLHLIPLLFLKYSFDRSFVEHPLYPVQEDAMTGIFDRYSISKREQEIVRLMLNGWSNQDIENELHISVRTVRNHLTSIYKKLGVKDRFQMANLFRNSQLSDSL